MWEVAAKRAQEVEIKNYSSEDNIKIMENQSRTAKSIVNIKVALLFYVLNLALQFFSRKIFLDYLGSEVLGLNTTAQNLLQFLNLAELGIGTAVSYNLYKPLYEKDQKAINSIISIQGWIYRRIACIVIVGACILMCFFPLIFTKADVPLWYAYGSFIAFLVAALLGYFVNYQQVLLSADQKEYKITFVVQGIRLAKIMIQILSIMYLQNGFLWWVIIEILMAIITSYKLNKEIKKEYPWLQPKISDGKQLQSKFPEVILKTKQIFFHKIGGFTLTQTSPLIIYAYTSLTLVAIYGNYMLIVSGVTVLANSLLNGVTAGIGNLVAEGNKQRIKSVFWEITSLRMWIASMVCFGIYILGDSFISLWVGEQYIMPRTSLIVIIMITYINLTRTNDAFIAAYGLYNDIWAPVVEALLNIGCSILLGYFWGLTGILSGVLISLLVIIYMWKPYFLYKYGFKESITTYIFKYIKYFIIYGFSSFISIYLIDNFIHLSLNTYLNLCIFTIISLSIFSVITLLLLYLTDRSSRSFIHRFVNLLKKYSIIN